MKLRSFLIGLLWLAIGGLVGWTASQYWTEHNRRAESMLALNEANNAAKRGDLDTAIQYAAQSYVLYPESPLAGMMVKELTEKRAAKVAACKQQ